MPLTTAAEVCAEKHKRVDEKLDRHEGWLKEHEVKIDDLVKSDVVNTEAITNLCAKISDLVTTLKWLIGFVVAPLAAGIIGLFFYCLQKGIFKP